MSSPQVNPLPWEQLVTDGHVRAARLRWMQPWLIALGALVIVVGLYIQMKVRPGHRGGNADVKMAADVNGVRAPVDAAVSRLPKLNEKGLNLDQMAAAAELPQVIDVILGDLRQQDKYNRRHINIQEVNVNAFWKKPWPAYHLISTSGRDVKLVGGLVKNGPSSPFYYYASQPAVQPWIGVFRKRHGSWQYATMLGSNLYAVPNQPSAPADLIPLTLKPVLPGNH